MTKSLRLVQAISGEEIDQARKLFLEYQRSIGIDLCFQNFAEELEHLPGEYGPPVGRLFLCYDDHELAGCVALRRIEGTICEMKRLYIRPAFRGRHIGRFLAETILREARAAGYTAMRLDTLAAMTEAIALYRSLGFKTIPPYRPYPFPDALYFELDLASS